LQNFLERIEWARVPGGLFRLARKTNAAFCEVRRSRRQWELHFLIVAACFGRGRPQFPPSSGIGKSRLADQDTGVGESVKKNAQRIATAVGQQELLSFEHETFCDVRAGFLILRLHGELLRREASQFAQHSGSATGGVFIKVQAHFAGSAFSRRFVGLAP